MIKTVQDETGIEEAMVEQLVRAFYLRVREAVSGSERAGS